MAMHVCRVTQVAEAAAEQVLRLLHSVLLLPEYSVNSSAGLTSWLPRLHMDNLANDGVVRLLDSASMAWAKYSWLDAVDMLAGASEIRLALGVTLTLGVLLLNLN